MWGRFGVGLGSIWGPFGVRLGSIWDQFGVDLGSVRGRFGVGLSSIVEKLGKFCRLVIGKGEVRKGMPAYEVLYGIARHRIALQSIAGQCGVGSRV